MKNLKILFWITIFINSFLLFLIEPIFGKMILPIAGGSMSSWNIALMCFQILLLGGYMYTHYLPKLIGFKAYIKVHLVILLFSAIFSFIYFQIRNFSVNSNAPTLDIILILLSTIGIPFFVVSTSSTNFQRWYGLVQKESPYHLYSLSNAGNLLALIGYVLFVEVLFGLKNQIFIWNVLYGIAVIIGVYIGIKVYRQLDANDFMEVNSQFEKFKKEKIKPKRKFLWLLLSFIPCSLMIATNTVLDNTINVNDIHFFWLLPLILFLIAYIVAFSKLKLLNIDVFERITYYLLLVILLILFTSFMNYIYVLAMLLLFMVSLVCNLYLVKDIPDESNLTEFYLYIAIGGALGGIFSSIVAPLIFSNVYEYPIIIIFFIFTMLFRHKRDKVDTMPIDQWEYSILFILGISAIILKGISLWSIFIILIILMTFIMRRLYISQKTRLKSILLFLVLTLISNYFILGNIDYQARNFYGIKTIKRITFIDKEGNKQILVNLLVGNTIHGSQFEKGNKNEFEALTYYERKGTTIGRFFTTNKDRINTVGLVGLGVGSLSALSENNQKWKYFEIDPQILEIARNTKYLTMMNKYKHEVILGDARITLQSEKDKYYDVLVLDAYSGDIIPANLLTKESVELYLSKLKEDGILLFHISNKQFDLNPVLSTVADELGIACYVDSSESVSSLGTSLSLTSTWVMMTNNKNLVSSTWKKIQKFPNFELWTDDKYSISRVLIK